MVISVFMFEQINGRVTIHPMTKNASCAKILQGLTPVPADLANTNVGGWAIKA